VGLQPTSTSATPIRGTNLAFVCVVSNCYSGGDPCVVSDPGLVSIHSGSNSTPFLCVVSNCVVVSINDSSVMDSGKDMPGVCRGEPLRVPSKRCRRGGNKGDLGGNFKVPPPPPGPSSTYHFQMELRYQAEMSGGGERMPRTLQPVQPVPLRLNDSLYIGKLAAARAKMDLANEKDWQLRFGRGSVPSPYLDPEVDVMPGEPGYGGGAEHPSPAVTMAKLACDLNGGALGERLNQQASQVWISLLPSNYDVLARHDALVVHHNQTAKERNEAAEQHPGGGRQHWQRPSPSSPRLLEEFVAVPRAHMKVVAVAPSGVPVVMPVIPCPFTWSDSKPAGNSESDPIEVE
jgi:hypothetical protein